MNLNLAFATMKRHCGAGSRLGLACVPMLCVVFSGCQRGGTQVFGTNTTPVKSFDGTFEMPPSALDPVPQADRPDGNAGLNPAFTYWLAAGDQVLTSWTDFTVQFPCLNSPIGNLCGGPYADFPANCGGGMGVPFVTQNCPGTSDCPRVVLFECPNRQCSNKRVVQVKSISEGCSPTAAPFTPTEDATFQLWAGVDVDAGGDAAPPYVPKDLPEPPNKEGGESVNVMVVPQKMPRVDLTRRQLTQDCGPPPSSPCTNADPGESHWSMDATQLHEGFSARLRVKEVRVYKDMTGTTEAAFCWAQTLFSNRTDSDCNALILPMGDCTAQPTANLTPASPPHWTVGFFSKPPLPDGTTFPSRCPNVPSGTTLWIEFKLDMR